MIPRMTALIALLALLLSGPTCRAESLGGVPQVVDAGAGYRSAFPTTRPAPLQQRVALPHPAIQNETLFIMC